MSDVVNVGCSAVMPPPESLIPSPATVHHLPEFQDVSDSQPVAVSSVKVQCILWSCLQTFMRKHWTKRTPTQQVHMNVIHLLTAVTIGIHD